MYIARNNPLVVVFKCKQVTFGGHATFFDTNIALKAQIICHNLCIKVLGRRIICAFIIKLSSKSNVRKVQCPIQC